MLTAGSAQVPFIQLSVPPILRLHLCRTYHANRFTFDYSKILLTYRCMVVYGVIANSYSMYQLLSK